MLGSAPTMFHLGTISYKSRATNRRLGRSRLAGCLCLPETPVACRKAPQWRPYRGAFSFVPGLRSAHFEADGTLWLRVGRDSMSMQSRGSCRVGRRLADWPTLMLALPHLDYRPHKTTAVHSSQRPGGSSGLQIQHPCTGLPARPYRRVRLTYFEYPNTLATCTSLGGQFCESDVF